MEDEVSEAPDAERRQRFVEDDPDQFMVVRLPAWKYEELLEEELEEKAWRDLNRGK